MFRFEYFENVVSKHHLNNVSWKQAAQQSALNMYHKSGWFSGSAMTVCHTRMVDDDTLEIIKRRN
jgi:hypothetical protein